MQSGYILHTFSSNTMFAVIDSEFRVLIEFQHYLYIRLTLAGGNDSEYSWRDGQAGFCFAIGKKANVDDDGWELDDDTTPIDYSSPSAGNRPCSQIRSRSLIQIRQIQ